MKLIQASGYFFRADFKLRHYRQVDPGLASVRDPEAEEERDAWLALWKDVEVLLKKARGVGP